MGARELHLVVTLAAMMAAVNVTHSAEFPEHPPNDRVKLSPREGQPVPRMTDQPIAGTSWTDEPAGRGTMRYWVVAVDALGQEGFLSAPRWHHRQWQSFYEPFVGEWHQQRSRSPDSRLAGRGRSSEQFRDRLPEWKDRRR